MSNFIFIKQKNNTKINVWYKNILIGELSSLIREKKDIDWQKYRSDKTLKMTINDRWDFFWSAHANGMMKNIGIFNNKEDAAAAILSAHEKKYLEDLNE